MGAACRDRNDRPAERDRIFLTPVVGREWGRPPPGLFLGPSAILSVREAAQRPHPRAPGRCGHQEQRREGCRPEFIGEVDGGLDGRCHDQEGEEDDVSSAWAACRCIGVAWHWWHSDRLCSGADREDFRSPIEPRGGDRLGPSMGPSVVATCAAGHLDCAAGQSVTRPERPSCSRSVEVARCATC